MGGAVVVEFPSMERVVFYALPAVGHLMSMVELGKLLLSQNPSLSITILSPTLPVEHNLISSYISSVSSVFPAITFHTLPPVPLLLGNPSNYSNREQIAFEIVRNNNTNLRKFLQSQSLSCLVSAVILDFFCYSALDVTKSLNIPTYFYFPTNASALALFLNFPEFDKIASDSFRNLGTTPFEIPGLFSVPASSMLEPMLDRGVSYDEFVNMGAHLARSDGIIINTFESLESKAVKALRDGTCLPGTPVPPIYCIGPLIADRGESNIGGEKNECLSWLDSQPSRSVVYLGFGSGGVFNKEQTREIAIGLERSGVKFLWVVRATLSADEAKRFQPPSEPDLDSILPDGFLERTKDRGLIVKSWAPQIEVLGHDAVGGFVTHCGWNSSLEAVCAGVPMVAWPLYAEQRFNKILLVEEIGVALPMDESEDWFVKSDEIERRVKQIIGSEEGDVVRKRVSDLSHEAKAALGEGGSSKVALAKLVESWKKEP